MFVIGGLQAIHPMIPAQFTALIDGVLGLAAVYFHVTPSQNYDTSNIKE